MDKTGFDHCFARRFEQAVIIAFVGLRFAGIKQGLAHTAGSGAADQQEHRQKNGARLCWWGNENGSLDKWIIGLVALLSIYYSSDPPIHQSTVPVKSSHQRHPSAL